MNMRREGLFSDCGSSGHLETDGNVSNFPARLPGGDHCVLVPRAKYNAAYLGYEGFWFLGKRPKVAIWWQLLDDEYGGNVIPAYYNVKSLEGPHGKIGRLKSPSFKIGWRSDLARDLSVLFPLMYGPKDLPTKVPCIIDEVRLKTRTVTTDRRQRKRVEAFHSSVVDHIIGWVE